MPGRYLRDVARDHGLFVDGLKFAGGVVRDHPRAHVRELIDLCHEHDVYASTGGFVEW